MTRPFTVIEDPEEAARIRAMPKRGTHGIAAALRAGSVLHFENASRRDGASGWASLLRKQGYRVVTRQDEAHGLYVWAEKVEARP